MDLHQSANLEWNLYPACDSCRIDQNWKIERWVAEYVSKHIRVAHLLFLHFEFSHCHHMSQVTFWAKVAPIVVEVNLYVCTSRVYMDSLLCHCGKEGSCLCDFYKPLPGVFLLHPSQCYARETQHPASSPLRLRHEISWLVVASSLLRCTKSLLLPLWPYSRQDTSRTVQAISDLPVLW